jgi:hypothetical protein
MPARFAALLVVLTLSAPAFGAPPAASSDASCKSFVQAFYTRYVRLMEKDHSPSAFEVATRSRRSSFGVELRRALAEDEAAAARSPGEIVGLDFDPFLNAQDFAPRYTVGKVTRKGAGYRVEVFGHWNGPAGKKPDVIPELVRQSGRWVFVNFHYPGEKGEPSDDLLSILKALKKDRAGKRR